MQKAIIRKKNAQGTMVKRCLKDILKLRKLSFVKNAGAHFTLDISTTHPFGRYAYNLSIKMEKANLLQ